MGKSSDLIVNTKRGLFCPAAGVYFDAWEPVERNIVTHGHADHARQGSAEYLCARDGVGILRRRMIEGARIDTLEYGESVNINGVKISLHPAGHVLGSSQIRVESRGEVWVISGDYKVEADRTCAGFELVRCDTFITECTFGLPIFKWGDAREEKAEINAWWKENQAQGRTSLLAAYCLGKAQRVLGGLDEGIGPILLHGSMMGMVEAYREAGIALPAAEYASEEKARECRGRALVLAPNGALGSPWVRKFGPASVGAASGWMKVRGFRRRKGVDRGFVLSDHADWPGLLGTIEATGAKRIIATHGYTGPMARALRERGYEAEEFKTRFKGAEDEIEESEAPTAAPVDQRDEKESAQEGEIP